MMMTRNNLTSALRDAPSWVAVARVLQKARADPGVFGLEDEPELVSAAATALSITATAVWTYLGAIEAKDAIAQDLDDDEASAIGLTKFSMARTELRKKPGHRSEIRALLIDQELSRRALASAFRRVGEAGAQDAAAQSRQAGRDFERRLRHILEERPSLLGFEHDVSIRAGEASDPIPVDMLATARRGDIRAAIEAKMLRPRVHRQLVTQTLGQLMLLAHVYREAWLIVPERSERSLQSVSVLASDLRLSGIRFAVHRTDPDDQIKELAVVR